MPRPLQFAGLLLGQSILEAQLATVERNRHTEYRSDGSC